MSDYDQDFPHQSSSETSGARSDSYDPGVHRGPPPPGTMRPGLPRKSVTAAVLMSLFPGVGQVYAGYVRRGFAIALTIASIIFLLNVDDLRHFHPFLGIMLPFLWIFNLVDAGRCAQIYNQVVSGTTGPELPSELPLPTDFGGRTGGVALVVVGSLLLMVTVFDFSLAWLEDWWPAGLIGLGVYMIRQSGKD